MTRADAIHIMSQIWGGNQQHDLAIRYVDAFVALGILKLDKPKTPSARLAKALGWSEQGACHDELTTALAAAGLQIVEKMP